MKYCWKCGAELMDEAVVCPKCGCAVAELKQSENQGEKKNTVAIVGFILSFLFAIPGLVLGIIGLVQSKKLNGEGKGFSIAAIVISAVSFVIEIVVCITVIAATIAELGF